MLMYVWFLLAGAFAGTCAGLFGVGGGLIIVPVLMAIFSAYGYSPEVITHLAVGTSLATIIITSISSIQSHHKRGGVRWDVWKNMSIGLVIGSLFGAYVADMLKGQVLAFLIAGMALFMGVQMLRAKKSDAPTQGQLPSAYVQGGVGGLIGLASAVFGIGGGSFTVPFLSRFGLEMKQAVGTSSACGLPIAAAGALGFMFFGRDVQGLPSEAVGFVHVSAFICISVMSYIFAKFGAKLAHQLPASTLKRAFGGLLLIVGTKMMLGALGVSLF
ncbi:MULTISPECIES: sulfite exporter TauE/SafE family protein [unclassified Moraxella]|uniref:sulfite exporter TauE/SafE family protein n=1 Tax=unclassified Moraxella TaxID=2685852 RepID=UPI003AF76C9C